MLSEVSPESERFWKRLVSLVREQRVIPIVGTDLTTFNDGQQDVTLDGWVIRHLPPDIVPPELRGAPGTTLNDLAYSLLRDRRTQQAFDDLYVLADEILRDDPPPLSPALEALASIREFSLFVSTTYDSQLTRALDLARFGGQPRTRALRYALGGGDDIPGRDSVHEFPIVYHLMGRSTAIPGECALTEEDTLEFLHALQSEQRRPRNLFNALHRSTLLILGSGFPDWVTRFFLRVTHPDRLIQVRGQVNVLAESRTKPEPALRAFIEHVAHHVRVHDAGAVEFTQELSARLASARSTQVALGDPATQPKGGVAAITPPPHAIFISYAREDLAAAERVVHALTARKLPVWFDKGALQAGDRYAERISDGIRRSALFVPLVSRRVLTADRRFFFREWNEAIDASKEFSRTFIVPCALDDVPRDATQIPRVFRELHMEPVSTDAGLERFASEVERQYERARQNMMGGASSGE